MIDAITAARDAEWLAHRYDPGQDAVHFRHVPRAAHAKATFITDEHLPAGGPPAVFRRGEVVPPAPPAPLHFIFHSAFCGSTLLARAFDRPGVSMGLKEPVILNDIVGWRHRGGDPNAVGAVLDSALTLLARPFAPGEAVVVKPSNVVSGLALPMMAMRPAAKALLLHAPLRIYLGSVAKKGMDGRLWVRTLFAALMKDGLIRFDYDGAQYFGQTDLQIAAIGWLAQHALFAEMAARFPDRVRTLDSETLTAEPARVMAALAALYGLPLDAAAVADIVAGPAFTTHSKGGGKAFDHARRAAENAEAASLHADEIETVAVWAEAVAAGAGVPMAPPAPLVD